VPCDAFITEATFGLPVFRHPPPDGEIAKLLRSLTLFPERTHVIGAYALGKAQRVIALIRASGEDRPIYIHGALANLIEVYQAHGIDLGDLRPATGENRKALAGAIVVAPPSALQDRWARRLVDPVVAMASGWMRIRQRARQRGVELPMILSDHGDWDELLATIDEVDPAQLWVTHGQEEALVHVARQQGRQAMALSLLGYEEEEG
jgi:putative mRNA 3-end processing factor